MQLKDIDKARYRRHLNLVIAACIAALAAGSLGIARIFIVLFPSDSGSHFHWNLLGVALSCFFIAMVLRRIRDHDFMYEVVYVWELKQALNRITRRMAKIKKAAAEGNTDAMLALQFSYAGSRQLWQLDDNTITMEELGVWQAELDALARKYSLSLNVENYDPACLKQF